MSTISHLLTFYFRCLTVKMSKLDCWTVGLLDCWTVGLLDSWTVGLLDSWTVKTLSIALLVFFILTHTTRMDGYTLGAASIDILYIFRFGMMSRFQNYAQKNRPNSRFWEKLSFGFLALTLENMFSVIALDPDGISKKFLCLNNFSINSRKSFAFAKFR